MPFKSDKQRRFLWSQKPEVARKFAQHHNDGGWVSDLKTWWNQGDDNAMVKRNREYAAYTSARNAGNTDLKFKDWQEQNKEALKAIDGKSVQSPKETVKMIAEMAPVIGDGVALSNAYDSAKEGDWGNVAFELGTTAVGWVPFAGPLAEAGIRGAKNADLAMGAVKHGWDPDYAKLFAREVAGKKGPTPKSVGASAKHGEWNISNRHVLDPKQAQRHAKQNVGKTTNQVLDDAADAQAIYAGKIGGGGKDKIAKNVDTFEGPRDFIQYEDPQGNIKHFLGKDGNIRTTMAGDAEFGMLGNEIDTPKTWKGRGPLTEADYKATGAAAKLPPALQRFAANPKAAPPMIQQMLRDAGLQFNRGGRIGPLGGM